MKCMRDVAEEDRETGIICVYIECGKGFWMKNMVK